MLRNADKDQIIIRLSLIREILAAKSVHLAPTNQVVILKTLKNLADFAKFNAQTVFMVICNEQCIKFAATLLMLACLAECVFGRRLLLRAICGGLSSVFSGLSAGLLVHLYSLSGGPDAGRSFLQLYLPVAAYALIFICGAFLLIKNALAREAEPDI